MPMSPRKAPATCCSTVATLAFQPKRPSASSPPRSSHTRFGPAGDAVAVGVVGIGGGEDRRLGDGLEQAHADHLRRQPGRDHRVVAERPERLVGRRSTSACVQRVRRAVGVAARRSSPARRRRALRPGRRGWRGPGAGRRTPDARPARRSASPRAPTAAAAGPSRVSSPSGSGGAPAPVEHVARRARLAVERRPEAVAGVRSRPARSTQFLVKKLSPTSKRRRSAAVRLGAGKASEVPRQHVARRVAAEVGVRPGGASAAARDDRHGTAARTSARTPDVTPRS